MNRRRVVRPVVIALTTTVISLAGVWVLEDHLDFPNRPVQRALKTMPLRARWLWLPGLRLTDDRVSAFYVRARDAFLDRHEVSLSSSVPVVMFFTHPPPFFKNLGPRYEVVNFHEIERRAQEAGTYGFLIVGPATESDGMVALHVEVEFQIEGSPMRIQEKYWCWPFSSTCQPDT